MEDNVTLCTNCQRQIAASNFVTHSLHCQRNLVKCESCGEAVPRSGLEEHHAEFHALVACPNCSIKTERTLLDKHQETLCKFRQQNCQFCELEFAVSDLNEHENYCGSRTKLCDGCGEYVMLKHEKLHLNSDHVIIKNSNEENGPSSKLIQNNLESVSPKKFLSNNNLKKPQLSSGKFNSSAENEDVDDLSHLIAHLNKPKVWALPRHGGVAYSLTGAPQRTISPSSLRQNSFSDDDNEGDLVALPCEFCNAMIPSNQLLLHQTGCEPEIASFGFQTKSKSSQLNLISLDSKVSPSDSNSFVDVVDSDDSDIEIVSTVSSKKLSNEKNKSMEYDDTELPCEFCGEGYPPSLLLDHQNVCDCHPKNWRVSSPVNQEPVQLSQSPNLVKQQRLNKDINCFQPKNTESVADSCPNSNRAIAVSFHLTPLTSEETFNSPIPAPGPSHKQILKSEELLSPSLCTQPLSYSERVPNCTLTPMLSSNRPLSPLAVSPAQNRIESHSLQDTVIGLQSSHHISKDCRAANPVELFQLSKKGQSKGIIGTSCDHCSHQRGVSQKIPGSLKKIQEVSCTSSLFAHQHNLRPAQNVQNHRKTPDVLRTLPPNLSSSFRQYQNSGINSERIQNPLADSYHNNRASVATEWNDLNLSRPTSATGAIPKAGKLNIARQVTQEIPRPRSSNNKVKAASRTVGVSAGSSHNHPLPRTSSDKSPVRNEFQDWDQ